MPGESSSDLGSGWRVQIRAAWRTKLAMAVVLPVFFCGCYFPLEHFRLFEPRTLPISAVDRVISFQPGWVWGYQSIYLLINAVPWLARSRGELLRYVRGFLLLCCISFGMFLVFPVRGPRPEALPPELMYRVLVWYDRPLNSFPSLHAGLLVYNIAFVWRVLGNRRSIVCGVLCVWSALICYAALAIKEHYAIDIVAGGVLAVVCDQVIWQGSKRVRRQSMPHLETG